MDSPLSPRDNILCNHSVYQNNKTDFGIALRNTGLIFISLILHAWNSYHIKLQLKDLFV